MSTIESNKIASNLFQEDIRSKDFKKYFEKIFEIKIEDFLSDYDEIDEFPVEIEDKGIMIGFIAQTTKVPPQISYIDLDVVNYPINTGYLAKEVPVQSLIKNPTDIQAHLIPFQNLRIYYSLYNQDQIDRIIFQYQDLRYELSLTKDSVITRIRVCIAEIESNINMSTYYLFDN
ncbi:hypothetical protein [Sphingobacterium sp. DR205]|uniref:hypothetical protein n=1 Tax=Sphingobacterium sp. DR205 TaxID=2713573 RepID=UPI0013E4D2BB|nr:hypothetical protein [Sphingobacterium sp. DR205]QIH33141.1 hypothetical protein G6053_09705 [Sphingobacterium sp. DR205]